jgi:hypothetical protein
MSTTNGLNAADEKKLTRTLRQLEAITPKRCLLGGNESRQLMDLTERIKLRLNPAAASELDSEAQLYLDQCRQLDWFEPAMKDVAA